MDTFPCHEHILGGGAPGASEGKFVPQEHDIFHLPERLFSTRTTRQHIIDIAAPLPVTKVSPQVVKSGRQKDSAFCTYGISYAGHLDFSDHQGGDAIARQVQAVGFSAGSYSYPLWIAACEYKGILRMRLVQSFESDRLATVIYQELAALFPATAYTDRGHHDFDSFPLGSVPRKDNK
ncbi:MAG: hypothetical protein K6E15_04945 [Prevotella sp.]|nr:hypothetical protein [Prevotella sp.]